MNKTEGFECLGHSNWTICSPSSPFCLSNFQFVSSLYWEAISYYPRGLPIGEKREFFQFQKLNETEVFVCLGHSNWTIYSPFSPFCSQDFLNVHLSYWGPFLITPEANNGKGGNIQLQKWMRPGGLSAWGIQTGPFASL